MWKNRNFKQLAVADHALPVHITERLKSEDSLKCASIFSLRSVNQTTKIFTN